MTAEWIQPLASPSARTWCQTYGGVFRPLDPRPEDIRLEDIAHALARICRFNGHGKWFSVAQHSVLVSRQCQNYPLEGLMHDAAETYVGDVIRPIKRLTALELYCLLERRIQQTIAVRFGLRTSRAIQREVQRADMVMLATEVRDIMGDRRMRWDLPHPPVATRIRPWGIEQSEEAFLERFRVCAGRAAARMSTTATASRTDE